MKLVEIYTDGACSGNPGPGGWSAILLYNEIEKEISGYEPNTTNQRMELTAAVAALKTIKYSCRVKLYSDSAYLINAFCQHWLDNWVSNGWLNSQKKPVENQDLWKELFSLEKEHQIEWVKVPGHRDNVYNNRCDQIARDAIKQATVKQEKTNNS